MMYHSHGKLSLIIKWCKFNLHLSRKLYTDEVSNFSVYIIYCLLPWCFLHRRKRGLKLKEVIKSNIYNVKIMGEYIVIIYAYSCVFKDHKTYQNNCDFVLLHTSIHTGLFIHYYPSANVIKDRLSARFVAAKVRNRPRGDAGMNIPWSGPGLLLCVNNCFHLV